MRVTADTVVLSAGAVNSAALLLASGTDRHPAGLGNSSGLVGRNYMAHISTMMEAFHPFQVNPTSFQKTVAINDFYSAGPGSPLPVGSHPVAGPRPRLHRHGRAKRPAALGRRRAGCAAGWTGWR